MKAFIKKWRMEIAFVCSMLVMGILIGITTNEWYALMWQVTLSIFFIAMSVYRKWYHEEVEYSNQLREELIETYEELHRKLTDSTDE